MWLPLTIFTGLLILASGIAYTQLHNPLKAEREQQAAAINNNSAAVTHKKEAEKAKETAGEELTEAKAELDKNQQDKLAAVQAKEAKNAELTKSKEGLAGFEKELADLEQKLKNYGGLDVLAGELKQLEAKKAELETSIAKTKDTITATIAHKEKTDKLIAAVKEKDLWQKTGTMVASFTTRVRSVSNADGFVELGAGDSTNVVRGAKLFVMRWGSPVGRLIVSDLKPNSSIATIVPGSVGVGVTILPGDLVVMDSTSTPAALKTEAPEDTVKKDAAPKKNAPVDVADPFAIPSDAPAAPATAPEAIPPTPAEPEAAPAEPEAAPAEPETAPAEPETAETPTAPAEAPPMKANK